MNVQNTFKDTINEVAFRINDDSHINDVISRLIGSINQSKIVAPNVKKAINQYFGINSGQKMMVGGYSNRFESKDVNSYDLLLATTIYYLSDLNRYDFNLINYAYNYGLDIGNIITLLLLNNIYDINDFCKKYNLYSDQQYTISTLKKLSALYKIQFNF